MKDEDAVKKDDLMVMDAMRDEDEMMQCYEVCSCEG